MTFPLPVGAGLLSVQDRDSRTLFEIVVMTVFLLITATLPLLFVKVTPAFSTRLTEKSLLPVKVTLSVLLEIEITSRKKLVPVTSTVPSVLMILRSPFTFELDNTTLPFVLAIVPSLSVVTPVSVTSPSTLDREMSLTDAPWIRTTPFWSVTSRSPAVTVPSTMRTSPVPLFTLTVPVMVLARQPGPATAVKSPVTSETVTPPETVAPHSVREPDPP